MSREQFLEAIKKKIVTDRFIWDPVRMPNDVVAFGRSHVARRNE